MPPPGRSRPRPAPDPYPRSPHGGRTISAPTPPDPLLAPPPPRPALPTPTERRILTLLSDGFRHDRKELHECMDPDTRGPLRGVRTHVSNIRKLLRPRGEDIVCVMYNGGIFYQWVRLIGSAANGKT